MVIRNCFKNGSLVANLFFVLVLVEVLVNVLFSELIFLKGSHTVIRFKNMVNIIKSMIENTSDHCLRTVTYRSLPLVQFTAYPLLYPYVLWYRIPRLCHAH